jgi:hypothetical protein
MYGPPATRRYTQQPMATDQHAPLPDELKHALSRDFFIRFTMVGRRTGAPRTTETTFVWNAQSASPNRIYVSGYPGKRDYVANALADPTVTIHTVERGIYYDIAAVARVITDRNDRTGPLLAFLDRWANRPEGKQRVFSWLIGAIKINRRLHLPWWGPFYLARRIMDRMPCVELTFVGPAIRRLTPPPPSTSDR